MSDRPASRRLVTVVFCDLVGSTSLAADADPESVRPLVTRYFETLRDVVERHGGVVEKFIGDAVMAVFGVPVVHEDDALRAVRAAWEMAEAAAALETGAFPALRCRVGVNTGEVFAGDLATQEGIVTGAAVNLAARLETAAAPGEVLLGPATHRLVRGAVRSEPVPALELKGFEEPVAAHRLLGIDAGVGGQPRRHDHAMVDRERELSLLHDVLERATAGRRSQLFTMLGAAGVGKSRLVEEFVTAAGARTLRGRCLPYGEGITFWPVAEMVSEAAGLTGDEGRDDAHRRIEALLTGPRASVAASRVADVVGVGGEPATPDETLWAIRTLFESIAHAGPLVLVFDDIHWAEPTLLELIQHIVTWSRDAPIMLVCLARPELLEEHPTWGGGTFNATSVLLDPLSDDDAARLIATLLGRVAIDPAARERIVAAAGGNPLFVEELLAMLIDDGTLVRRDERWIATGDIAELAIPPSITALLTARLDRLPRDEQVLVEHAAIVGKVFSGSAVQALVPPGLRPSLDPLLGSLTRKELIRATTPEGMYRFRHQLIRDAAYQAMPKRHRAELHQTYAGWLASRPDGGSDEMVGYHLEQAHRFVVDVGGDPGLADDLADRAGHRLGAAGTRAFARGDARASVRLLTRAATLLPEVAAERAGLLEELAESRHVLGELDAAVETLETLRRAAGGDPALEAWAGLRRDEIGFLADPRATPIGALRSRAADVAAALERAGDEAHLASVLAFLALLAWLSGSAREMVATADRALALGLAAGNRRTVAVAAGYVGRGLELGPTPCEEALVRLTDLMDLLEDDRVARAACGLERAITLAMLRRADEAAADVAASTAALEELGQRRWLAQATGVTGLTLWAAGQTEAAEAALRAGYAFFHGQGDLANATPAACDLAHVLADLGRFDEVARLADEVARTAGEHDLEPQIGWRTARARAAIHRGDVAIAERLIDEALALSSGTDFLGLQGDTHLYRAEVLYAARRPDEARAALETALARYAAKGDLAEHAAAERLAEAWAADAGR